MIICEVLEVTPYELLVGTENEKLKDYKRPDAIVIDMNSKEYQLIETYQKLGTDGKERLMAYVKTLREKK